MADIKNKKNGETRCAECHTPCQGFKDPTGKILCWDCYIKIWGKKPTVKE